MEWLRTLEDPASSRDLILFRRGLDFIGAGYKTVEIARDESSCAQRVSRKKCCGIGGAKLTAGQMSAVGVPGVIARGTVEYSGNGLTVVMIIILEEGFPEAGIVRGACCLLRGNERIPCLRRSLASSLPSPTAQDISS
jgi:hypothetical protein